MQATPILIDTQKYNVTGLHYICFCSLFLRERCITCVTQEAFEKCWAHLPLWAATLPFTRCRYCRTPPAHQCPQWRRRRQQRQRVTERTAMAPQNGPNNLYTTAKQVAMTRACLVKKTTGWRNVWSMKWRVPDPEIDQKRTWREAVRNDCHARKVNGQDAMDRSRSNQIKSNLFSSTK